MVIRPRKVLPNRELPYFTVSPLGWGSRLSLRLGGPRPLEASASFLGLSKGFLLLPPFSEPLPPANLLQAPEFFFSGRLQKV